MADVIVNQPSPLAARAPFRLSWGAIFGGAFIAVAISVMLYALSLAIGLGGVDPGQDRGMAMGALGIGLGLATLLGLFIGGFVAARSVLGLGTWGRILHGGVVWALTSLVALFLAWSLVSAVVGTAVGLAGQAAGLGGRVLSGSTDAVGQALGLTTQDILAPINSRLEAQGKPPVTMEGLQAALQDSIDRALRTGQLDREAVVDSLARNTALDEADAEEIATMLEARWQQVRQQLGGGAAQVVGQAAEVSSDIAWGLFFMMLLGLAAAVVGGLVGKRREPPVRTEQVERVPLGGPPREVYP